MVSGSVDLEAKSYSARGGTTACALHTGLSLADATATEKNGQILATSFEDYPKNPAVAYEILSVYA
ncbi:hypothetical protein PG995_002896 [Apiospora arundinis]